MDTEHKQKIAVLSIYLILTLSLLLYLFTSLEIRSDMSFFVADKISTTDKIIQHYLIEGDANRLLFLQLGTKQSKIDNNHPSQKLLKELADRSQQVKKLMLQSGRFSVVENGHKNFKLLQNNKLYDYRYLLNDSIIVKDKSEIDLFSVNSLKDHFKLLIDRLQMVVSQSEYQFIAQSPLNTWFNYLTSINNRQLKKTNGVWFYEQAGQYPQAIILLKTKAPGFDLKQQKENRDFIEHQLTQHISANVSYLLSGAPIIALATSEQITFQIKIISSIASLILAFFLISVFRSFKILILVSLPLFFAVLIGTSIVNLVYGYIHGISLAFGITIIGVAVDYPIHYFSQIMTNNKKSSLSNNKKIVLKIWPKLKLGLITTLIGFSAITFSSFSGLNQLGVFAITGLITAAISTRYLLPLFEYTHLNDNRVKSFEKFSHLFSFINFNFRNGFYCLYVNYFRYFALFLIVIALVHITTSKTLWENDLASLNPVSKELKQNDFKLRKALNLPELRYLLIISANSEQGLLEKTENLMPFLDQLISSGAISYYDAISRYLPSVKKQMERQQRLPDKKQLYDNLSQALIDSPLNIEAFKPFITAVDKNKTISPLSYNDLDDSLLSTKIKSMLSAQSKLPAEKGLNKEQNKHKKIWTGLIFLSGVDREKLITAMNHKLPASDYHSQTNLRTNSGANSRDQSGSNSPNDNPNIKEIKLIDIKTQTNDLVEKYRLEALQWFLLGSVLISLFIFAYIKKINAIPALFLPFFGATILTISLLLFLGYSLSIFHLVSLLLVVGLGIDYSIFIYHANSAEMEFNNNMQAINIFSVWLCAASSFIMFFSLSLSSIPVLKAIGLTASIGSALAFILTLIFSRTCNVNS